MTLIEQMADYVNRIYPDSVCDMKIREGRIAIQFHLTERQGNPLAIVFKDGETVMYEIGNEITQLYVVPIEHGLRPIENRLRTYYIDSMLERKK